MFKKILIANRGEIAVRVVRACRDLGIWTVALFDASDRDSLHVRLADECVEITSPLGYLDVQQTVELALATGAEAIHPGYGFLAEREDFSAACEAAGIVFIGPPSDVMAAFSNKIHMLKAAAAAGLTTPLHSSVSFQADEEDVYMAQAKKLGFPIVVKSCSGGRGRASRIVYRADELQRAVREAAAEGQMVFGTNQLYFEKMIRPATFLDVQILGDQYGTLIHLGERDGSIQRNNQKLLSEAPAPGLTPAQRARLHEMALQIARLFGYVNAGTIEFLMDSAGQFYFTEVKCRIQVEHPVTELATRRDLVREQIRVAEGLAMSFTQDDLEINGHAIEVRINAERLPDFTPCPGRITHFHAPGGLGVRMDSALYDGYAIPPYYDSLIGKLIVHGRDRPEALARLNRALGELIVDGIDTTIPLFRALLAEPDIQNGTYNIHWLEKFLETAKI